MKRKVVIASIIGLCIIAAGVYYFTTRHTDTAISWRTSVIEKGNITSLVTATGSLSAVTTVQVGTQVTGTISKLLADFNSIVRKGQIIAILDTTFLVASRDDAAANMEKARAQLNQNKREFDRTKKLFDERVSTQMDYDLSLTNYELARSNMNSAIALLNRAKINLQYATIRAPISGTVISRNVDVGQTVVSSFNSPTLFTIANDLTKMEVQANIDEADIGQIVIGQSVEFTVDAYPNEVFEGRVQQIRLQPVVLQNVVNYVVILDVPNPDLKLMPGLTANIDVKVQERKDVLKVAIGALHFTPPAEFISSQPKPGDTLHNNEPAPPNMLGESNIKVVAHEQVGVVWLLEGDVLRPERVITGASDGTYIEVQGPVKSGDIVITGVNHAAAAASTTTNPFMPKMPTRPRTR